MTARFRPRTALIPTLAAVLFALGSASPGFAQAPAAGEAPAGPRVDVSAYFGFDYLRYPPSTFLRYPQFRPAPAGFQSPLAGVRARGELVPNVLVGLEARFRSVADASLEEAYVGYRFSTAAVVRAGLYLVPFGIFNTINRPYETLLVEPSLIEERIHPPSWRDLGLVLDGRMGFLSYSGWLGNGLTEAPSLAQGQQFGDENRKPGYGGRLALALGRGIEIGGSYADGRYDIEATRSLVLTGLHAQWITSDWTLLGEYMRAKIDNAMALPAGKVEGFYVLALLNTGKLQPIVSYQKARNVDMFHGPWNEDVKRWTFGARLLLGGFVLKFEYDRERPDPAQSWRDVVKAQAAFSF